MYPWGEGKINKPQIFAGWPGAIGRPGPLESGLDTWCRAGVTGARVFFWHIFRPRFPYRVVRWENDRKSKKWSIPIFTDEWDETFFAEAEVLLRAMAARNMMLIATILDYKSIHYGEANVEDPWRVNWKWWEQLWPGHRFCTDGMNPHTLEWLDKIIPFLSSTSINYLVETINEFYVPDEKDSRFRWHKWLVNELEKRGIGKERLVTCARPAWRAIAEQGHYYSPHWIVTPKQWDAMEAALRNFPRDRVIPSGDGGRDGNAPEGEFGRGLGVEDAKRFAETMIERGHPIYEYWDQTSNEWGHGYLAPAKVMREIFDAVTPEPPIPPVPILVDICRQTYLLPNHSCKKIVREFAPGNAPTETCPIHHDITFWERLWEWLKKLFKCW